MKILRILRRDRGAMADLCDRFGKRAPSYKYGRPVIFAIVRDAATPEHLVREKFPRAVARDIFNTDHARMIRSAIAKLSAKQRKPIELSFYEGLSPAGMADRAGEPFATVKTWVQTAFQHLHEELEQEVTA